MLGLYYLVTVSCLSGCLFYQHSTPVLFMQCNGLMIYTTHYIIIMFYYNMHTINARWGFSFAEVEF